MKKLTTKMKLICIILAIVIIAGIAVIATMGFNVDLSMQSNNRVELNLEKNFETAEIKKITNEVFENQDVIIQKVEVFEDTVSITAKEITEEQKNKLVEKINAKYETEIHDHDIEVQRVPNMRLRDLIKPYLFAFGLSSVLVVLYMMIRYRKLGVTKVLLKTISSIVIAQVVLVSVIAIARIPVGRFTIPMAILVYLCTLLSYTSSLEKQIVRIKEEDK